MSRLPRRTAAVLACAAFAVVLQVAVGQPTTGKDTKKTTPATTAKDTGKATATPTDTGKASTSTEDEEAKRKAKEMRDAAAGGLCAGLGVLGVVLAVIAVVVVLVLDLLPVVIAASRGHPNTAAIVALQLLVGWWCWPVWVVSLVWSLTAFRRDDYD